MADRQTKIQMTPEQKRIKELLKKPLGRSRKMDADRTLLFMHLLRMGTPVGTACHKVGWAENTVYEWVARGEGRDPDRKCTPMHAKFANEYRDALADSEIDLLGIIRSNAKKDAKYACWLLERRHTNWSKNPKVILQIQEGIAEGVTVVVDKMLAYLQGTLSPHTFNEVATALASAGDSSGIPEQLRARSSEFTRFAEGVEDISNISDTDLAKAWSAALTDSEQS